MKGVTNQSFYAVLLGACALFLIACEVDDSGSSAAGEDENTGATVPDADDGFSAIVTESDDYTIVISKDGDGASACTATNGKKIECVIDIEELDLFSQGIKIGYAAPQSQCDYIQTMQYYYAWAPYGLMPRSVFYSTNDDTIIATPTGGADPSWNALIVENDTEGVTDECIDDGFEVNCDYITIDDVLANNAGSSNLGNNPDADLFTCSTPGNVDAIYGFDTDGDGLLDRLICHRDLFFVSAVEAGDVVCPWDYSRIEDASASSCCHGSYNLHTWDGAEADTADASWGDRSNQGNCYRGPGMDNITEKDFRGLPELLIAQVPADGLQASFDVDAPINKFDEQIYAANYVELSDHTGDTSTSGAFGGESITAPSIAALGYPTFEINCLDHARELKSQIRISVREWNLEAEFNDFIAGVLNADPNSEDRSDPYNNGTLEQEEDHCDYRGLERDADEADLDAGNELACSFTTYGSFGLDPDIEDFNLLFNPSDFYGVLPE